MKELYGYKNGINFGGWFSQCDYSEERFDNFIKDEDFKNIKSWGLDHVRIPVDYNLFLDDNLNFIENGFYRIQKCIDNCIKNNLNMILDLHKTVGFSFDDLENESGFFYEEKYQQIFYRIWEELTKRFSKYENMLAFELLNEVTNYEFKDKWNQIASECIKHIRSISPTIKILIGGYYNNAACAVKDIDVPIDDNIVFNFHCYEPLIFTHQGAYWIKKMDVNYRQPYKTTFKEIIDNTNKYISNDTLDYSFMKQDDYVSAEYFEALFKEAIDIAEKKGVCLYCGEYGVIEKANPEDTKEWYLDINSVFKKYGIGHAIWSYKEMDFDFVNPRYDYIRDVVIKG